METRVFPKQQYYDVFSGNYIQLRRITWLRRIREIHERHREFIYTLTREPPAQNDRNNSVFVRKTSFSGRRQRWNLFI